MSALAERVVAHVHAAPLALPVLSPVAMALHRALENPDVSSAAIERIIARDPAVATEVLRMANSVAFSGLTQIDTLREALIRLGTQRVGVLAIAAAQKGLYRSDCPAQAEYLRRLWEHAISAAHAARWLTHRLIEPKDAEAAFLAGLLHDIGKLALVRALEEIGSAEAGEAPDNPDVIELFNDRHAELGALLMTQWNLPNRLCTVARDHHSNDGSESMVAAVRLADELCAFMAIGPDTVGNCHPADGATARALHASELHLAQVQVLIEDLLGRQTA